MGSTFSLQRARHLSGSCDDGDTKCTLIIPTKAQQIWPAYEQYASPNFSGRVVLSHNGFLTQYPGNLSQIISTSHGCYQLAPNPPDSDCRRVLVHAGFSGVFNVVEIVPHGGRDKTPHMVATRSSNGFRGKDRQDPLLQSLHFLSPKVMVERVSSPFLSAVLWRKLAVNCVINPLTAIHKRQNGLILDMLTDSEGRRQIHRILEEFMIVCEQKVATVKDEKMSSPVEALLADGDSAVDKLAAVVQQVATDSRENWSSMAQDVWFRTQKGGQNHPSRGASRENAELDSDDGCMSVGCTEIGAINGFIVDVGASLGVATPENARLVRQVKARIRSTRT